MRHFHACGLFLMMTSFSLALEQAPEGTIPLQTRSREDAAIFYKTKHRKPVEMLFIHCKSGSMTPGKEWNERTKALLAQAKRLGAVVANDSVPEVEAVFKEKPIATVVLIGCMDGHKIMETVKGRELLFVRDLYVSAPIHGDGGMVWRAVESRVACYENAKDETCLPTMASMTSSALLGGAAFRPSEDRRPHLAVMVSDDHYDADKLLPPFVEKIAREKNLYLSVLHGEGGSRFPNIDELETADTLLVYVRRLALPKEQLEKVKRFVSSGKAVIGMRTASHGFVLRAKDKVPEGCENWAEFDRDILGGNYDNHGKNELGTEVLNMPEHAASPILAGVEPAAWHSTGSLYFTAPVVSDAIVYQTGSSPQRQNLPLTWTRRVGRTKVAYTGLGHQADYDIPAFRRLMSNLIEWSLTNPPSAAHPSSLP